jgi:hypothetical protein
MGEGNQGVWATCLIQCLNVMPMIFLKTTHPTTFEDSRRENIELG